MTASRKIENKKTAFFFKKKITSRALLFLRRPRISVGDRVTGGHTVFAVAHAVRDHRRTGG